jgi:hypothetical protein
MDIEEIIVYVSAFFWLFPPLRQFKGRYFYYFLVLALTDPIALFIAPVLKIDNVFIHSLCSLLLLISIVSLDSLKKLISILILVIISAAFYFIVLQNSLFILLSIHPVILIILIHRSLLFIADRFEINVFILTLIFYEISLIVNFIVFISGTDLGIIFFYLTVSFQILVAIFFILFRDDSHVLSIKIHLKG